MPTIRLLPALALSTLTFIPRPALGQKVKQNYFKPNPVPTQQEQIKGSFGQRAKECLNNNRTVVFTSPADPQGGRTRVYVSREVSTQGNISFNIITYLSDPTTETGSSSAPTGISGLTESQAVALIQSKIPDIRNATAQCTD